MPRDIPSNLIGRADRPGPAAGSPSPSARTNATHLRHQPPGNSSTHGSGDEVAPDLPPTAFQPHLVKPGMDVLQAFEILTMTMDRLGQSRMDLEKSDFNWKRTLRNESNQKAQDASNEMRAKMKEAQEKAIGDKIAGWFKVIGALIGAVAGIVGTAGAAAPLMAVAVVGAVMAAMDLANAIKNECTDKDGKPLNFDISIGGMVNAIAQAPGMVPEGYSEKQKQEWIMGWTLALNLTVAVAGLAVGGYQLKKMYDVAQSAKAAIDPADAVGKVAASGEAVTSLTKTTINATEQLAHTAKNIAAMVGGAADVVNGISTVSEGGLKIDLAHINRSVEYARADRDAWNAASRLYMARLRDSMDFLQQTQRVTNEGWNQLSDLIADSFQVQSKISRNI